MCSIRLVLCHIKCFSTDRHPCCPMRNGPFVRPFVSHRRGGRCEVRRRSDGVFLAVNGRFSGLFVHEMYAFSRFLPRSGSFFTALYISNYITIQALLQHVVEIDIFLIGKRHEIDNSRFFVQIESNVTTKRRAFLYTSLNVYTILKCPRRRCCRCWYPVPSCPGDGGRECWNWDSACRRAGGCAP